MLSETSFRALIENPYDVIVWHDYNGVIRFAFSSIRKFGGYYESELIGRSGSEFIHPDDLKNGRKLFIELLDIMGKAVTVFQRLHHMKDHYFWSEALLNQLSSRSGDQWYCFKLSRHHREPKSRWFYRTIALNKYIFLLYF